MKWPLGVDPSSATDQLLRALIAEVRELRRLVENTQRISPSIRHESLLVAIVSLVGEWEWNCHSLFECASQDSSPQAEQLRAALDALDIATPYALGTHLRGRLGIAANGLELRRLGLGANKVARWAVVCPVHTRVDAAAAGGAKMPRSHNRVS